MYIFAAEYLNIRLIFAFLLRVCDVQVYAQERRYSLFQRVMGVLRDRLF